MYTLDIRGLLLENKINFFKGLRVGQNGHAYHSAMETIIWNKKSANSFANSGLFYPYKLYYIPDFENFWSKELKVMAKKRFFLAITPSFFDLEKILIPINPPINRLCSIVVECSLWAREVSGSNPPGAESYQRL